MTSRLAVAWLAFALLLSAGCTILPQGSYWGAVARRPSEVPADAEALLPPQAVPTPAEAVALRAKLQAGITRRWSSETLARSACEMEGGAGRAVYADAMQTVVWFYVDPITYRRLIIAGIESLRAALDNEKFRERFPAAGDGEKRERFAEALDILFLKARAADPWFAFQAADWLAAVMEKNRAILGLPDGAVVAEFLFGAFDTLDPFSHYLTPEMLRMYREQLEGVYAGIGAEVAEREGRFFFKRVFEDGPAAKAGLKPGDEIVAVEGQALAGSSAADIGRRLRGKPGTSVTLVVRIGSAGEPRSIVLVRAQIHMPAVRDAQLVDPDRGIAYVRLAEFQDGAEAELRRAVDQLAKQGAKGLILDLRDNPGGSLVEAVWVAGMFLPPGPVIETRGRTLGATWHYDVPWLERQAWRGPLAVLTNGDTASAAELLASALARRGRATIVGRKTYGKGAVQVSFPVDWGASAVNLTIARVYDIKGQCLHGCGVTPDREVASAAAPPEILRDDPVVRAALEVLAAPSRPEKGKQAP